FQIGRIEGRWANFVPPIQGGRFRPYNKEDDEVVGADSSSQSSSRPSSPIFDAVEDTSGLRRRESQSTTPSSVASTPSPIQEKKLEFNPSFLDARTQEEIILDIAKYPPLDSVSQDNIVAKYRALERRIRE